MLLPDELVERTRTHPRRERCIRRRPLARTLRFDRIAEQRLRDYLRFFGGFVGPGVPGGAVCTGARIWNGSPGFPVAVTVSLAVSYVTLSAIIVCPDAVSSMCTLPVSTSMCLS